MAGLVDLTDLPGLNQYVDLYVTSDEDSDGIGESEKMGGGDEDVGKEAEPEVEFLYVRETKTVAATKISKRVPLPRPVRRVPGSENNADILKRSIESRKRRPHMRPVAFTERAPKIRANRPFFEAEGIRCEHKKTSRKFQEPHSWVFYEQPRTAELLSEQERLFGRAKKNMVKEINSGTLPTQNKYMKAGFDGKNGNAAVDNARGLATDRIMLGLPVGFTRKELKNSYRRLALKYHPDKLNYNTAESPERRQTSEHFVKITKAYNRLMEIVLSRTS
jgi:hypothetical protein